MKTTVDRSKWGRGMRSSQLLNPANGKMCCLGFRAIAGGAEESDILCQYSPADRPGFFTDKFTERVKPGKYAWQNEPARVDSELSNSMMRVNDRVGIGGDGGELNTYEEAQRESDLKALFAQAGEEIEFVDGDGEEAQS